MRLNQNKLSCFGFWNTRNNNDYENSREKEETENPTAEIRLATHDNGGMNIIAFK